MGKQTFMRLYAHQARTLKLEHMRSFSVIAYCDIDMHGGQSLMNCLGSELYGLLAEALTRLRDTDSEIVRRSHYLKLVAHLSTMNLVALEQECLGIQRMPKVEGRKPRKPPREHNSPLWV